jgi:hypothetical protein
VHNRAVRKLLSLVLVSLALLLSQQGAVSHEIKHLVGSESSQQDGDPGKSGIAHCLDCLAFDHIAGAVHSSFALPPLLETADFWRTTVVVASRAADSPTQNARAPPVL